MDVVAQAFGVRCAQDAVLARACGELDRRQDWRASGAVSLGSWLMSQLGVSSGTARAYCAVSERVEDLPHLSAGLSEGRLSLDKVRAVLGVAEPENEAHWAATAAELSFVELCQVVRSEQRPSRAADRLEHDRRSLRFNDSLRTVVAQLPALSYAQLKRVLEARAKKMGAPGSSLDQRLADALVSLCRSEGTSSSGGSLVVAHVPYELMADPSSELVGELEGAGLISADVVRRLVCEAEVIVALDDELGHTMYEGRAQRFPSDTQRREVMRRDRHCVFPGCHNVLFTNCHHIEGWKPSGLTDLGNLALLCEHHHHLIHSLAWSMSGDANVELAFVGPTGRVMKSRPSRLWARVSDPALLGTRRGGAGRGARVGRGAERAAKPEAKGAAGGAPGPGGGDRGG